MKLTKMLATMALALIFVHCGQKNFTSSRSATGTTLNDGGSTLPFSTNIADGTNVTAGTNGNTTGTSNGIIGSNQGVVQIVYGTNNGQPTGSPVMVQPDPLQVTCGEWISKQEIYQIHMANMLEATAPLPPRAENWPSQFSGISIEDASLNQVCAELGCGPALEVNYRRYHSPENNSVVYWQSDRWLKVLATQRNKKIDNKNGSAALLCSAPGSMTTGFIKKNDTD